MGKTADELNPYDPLDETRRDTNMTPIAARMDRDDDDNDDDDDDETAEEVEEIRADIEHTRAEMTETINAIQERLSPQHLMEQAKDTVRDATIGRVEQMVSNVGDKIGEVADQAQQTTSDVAEQAGGVLRVIRENPVPAALAGLGLALLFMKGREGDQRRRTTVYPTRIYPRYDTYPCLFRQPL
jgi:chromatin segregation and condensation protein Rec8/ScpA/Scc1 (kleisin family)